MNNNKTINENVFDKHTAMFAEYPDVVDVQTLKNMLNVGQVLAYKLVKSGEIKSRKVGREYKIPKVNVIAYLLGENGVKLGT